MKHIVYILLHYLSINIIKYSRENHSNIAQHLPIESNILIPSLFNKLRVLSSSRLDCRAHSFDPQSPLISFFKFSILISMLSCLNQSISYLFVDISTSKSISFCQSDQLIMFFLSL